MSQQLSELQAGLIFRAPLDSWNPTRDEISGVAGTATDTYNVLDSQGSGRRSVEYNGTSSYTQLPSVQAFGTGDFTVIVNTKYVTGKTIIGGNNAFGIYLVSNLIYIVKIGTASSYNASYNFILNSEYSIVVERNSGSCSIYINNVLIDTRSCTYDFTESCVTIGSTNILGYYDYYTGSISMCRIFNYSVDATTVRADGLTDLQYYSHPEYPIEWVDRGATGTVLTSGTLVAGKIYKIINWITTDDFTNIGGTNTDGTVFTATGTTPTTWTNSSTVVLLGAVLDLNASGLSNATSGYWYDRTNTLTATNSGTSLVVPPASNLGATYFRDAGSTLQYTGLLFGSLPNQTISFWINSQGLDLFPYGIIFYFNGGTSIRLNGSNYRLNFSRNEGTALIASVVNSFLANINYQICITSSGDISNIYINGVLSGSGTAGTSGSTTDVSIGNNTFNGTLSNFCVWNRVLDTDQIKLLYDTGF